MKSFSPRQTELAGGKIFVFWQNVPNHLQSPWLSALASRGHIRVIVATESANEVETSRRSLGWQVPNYGEAQLEVSVTAAKAARIIDEAGPDAVHVFTGVGAYPAVHEAFVQCCGKGRRIGLLAERSEPGGWLAGPRFAKGKLLFHGFGRHVRFVLGVGAGAPPWYQALGYERRSIFEFAYCPPLPDNAERPLESLWPGEGVRLLFIGQFVLRKGIDRLLRALGKIGGSAWVLNLLGAGNDEGALRQRAKKSHIADRVLFRGSMRNTEAMSGLAAADVLILPSRFDGYGAVVNEALLRGVPVICSAAVGARQVVERDPAMGSVFQNADSLHAALRHWIGKGPRTQTESTRVRQLAQCVSPAAVADYFTEIMGNVFGDSWRPIAPWRRPVL